MRRENPPPLMGTWRSKRSLQIKTHSQTSLGGGFKCFLCSPLITWGNDPIWLIFFKWVFQPPASLVLEVSLKQKLLIARFTPVMGTKSSIKHSQNPTYKQRWAQTKPVFSRGRQIPFHSSLRIRVCPKEGIITIYPYIPILFGWDWNPKNPIRSGRGRPDS